MEVTNRETDAWTGVAYNIKTDPRETGREDMHWIQLSQDKIQCLTFANAILTVGSIKAIHFLTS
jgi:hypothetical protein